MLISFGNFPWFWRIFCYPDPFTDSTDQNVTDSKRIRIRNTWLKIILIRANEKSASGKRPRAKRASLEKTVTESYSVPKVDPCKGRSDIFYPEIFCMENIPNIFSFHFFWKLCQKKLSDFYHCKKTSNLRILHVCSKLFKSVKPNNTLTVSFRRGLSILLAYTNSVGCNQHFFKLK